MYGLLVRLVDGASASEGRVEVNYQGSWGTICDNSWDINDATVICRMLGYPGVSSASVSFGEGTGDIILDNVECDGSETHIAHCSHSGYEINSCGHSEDVGVICSGEAELKVRLVDGPDESQARVELFYFGSWDDLRVRLVGGRSDNEGRVEILYLGTWGTVCDDNWGLNDANVVCKMLGYERAENFSCCAAFGLGSGTIVLDEVECEGTEPNIGHCRRSGYEIHDCDHSQDVGVSCIENGVDQESSTTMTPNGSEMGLSQPATYGVDQESSTTMTPNGSEMGLSQPATYEFRNYENP
eukprot:XP_011666693.1 PREDICTED: deleted in malignant brain tumors 1 protein-like [Strongylocentrotus purpuratus]